MMIPELIHVGDGLTLRHCRTEKFKSGLLSVSFVQPIRREKAYLTSLLFSVLLRGTKTYPSIAQLNKRLDYLFGTTLSVRNFYRGDSQVVGLAADLLDSRFLPPEGKNLVGDVAAVMEEVFFHPALDENGLLNAKYVESEKELQCDAIRARKNDPRGYARDLCREQMYAEEPCGAPLYGREEEVMAVTPEILTAYWHEFMAAFSPDCFYLGSADRESIANALGGAFLPSLAKYRAKEAGGKFCCGVKWQADAVKRTEESLPVSQGQLVIGLRTGCALGEAEEYGTAVMNEMLGVAPTSKLFINVRERMSLCYSISSGYDIYKGTILISCGLDPANREKAEKEIFRQIGLMREGAFTDEELSGAKKSLRNAYRQLEDSPAGTENFCYGRSLAGMNISPEAYSANAESVTREDVVRAAQRLSVDTVFFLLGTGNPAGDEDGEEEDDD